MFGQNAFLQWSHQIGQCGREEGRNSEMSGYEKENSVNQCHPMPFFYCLIFSVIVKKKTQPAAAARVWLVNILITTTKIFCLSAGEENRAPSLNVWGSPQSPQPGLGNLLDLASWQNLTSKSPVG
jgi:hypothetical protein